MSKPFSQLNDLLVIDGEMYLTWTLSKMDSNLAAIVKVLDGMNEPDKLRCLAAFGEAIHLIEWLRENHKNLNDLKFLVDLISISSTNENNNFGLDRTILAKTLKEAGSAYAALIYELKLDDDFFQFMELAKNVCAHLESDKNIAEKLLAVKDEVIFSKWFFDWKLHFLFDFYFKVSTIDTISKSRDNVEGNALNEVKLINELGVYFICKFDDRNNQATLDDVISLRLTIENELKCYSLEQLKDLQNIVMLAPQNLLTDDDEERLGLEYFVSTFSG